MVPVMAVLGIYPARVPCAVWVIRYELSLTPPTQHSNYKFRALITEFTLQIAHYFTFLHTLQVQACSIFYQFTLSFFLLTFLSLTSFPTKSKTPPSLLKHLYLKPKASIRVWLLDRWKI